MPVKKKVVKKTTTRRKTRSVKEVKRINEMLAWAKEVLLKGADGGMVFIAKITPEEGGAHSNALCVVTDVNRVVQLGAIQESFHIDPIEMMAASLVSTHEHK